MKTQGEFCAKFNSISAPAKKPVKKICKKDTSTTYLGKSKKPNNPKPESFDDNIKRVKRSIEINLTTSSRRQSAQLSITHANFRLIIQDTLSMYSYRILHSQRILPADHEKRLAYANFVIEHDAFWHSIIITDEAHFSLSGALNSQKY